MAKKGMQWYDWLSIVLLIIGGINWGLVGIFKFDLVAKILGSLTFWSRLIYFLVGSSAVFSIIRFIQLKVK